MDLSNKALALVLIIATTISIIGTVMTVTRLEGPLNVVSGRAATDTGTTNFSINSSISVVFISNNVNFGTGIINPTGNGSCTLNTTGPGMLNGANNGIGTTNPDCIGFNNSIQPLRIQNQGTLNVTLNMTFSQTASTFIGGTVVTPSFTYRSSWNDTIKACGGSQGLAGNATVNEVAAANANITICNQTRFNTVSGNNTLNLDLGIKIPSDAAPGTRLVTITAYASNP